ncbi:MAG: cytochrome b [Gammaproteobacteria bacterium]
MPRLLNTENSYGAPAVIVHWLSAAIIIGMFGLGYWMVDLDYYSSWYRRAPDIHKSVGMLFAIVFVFRLALRIFSPEPAPVGGTPAWQTRIAHAVHRLFYVLIGCHLIAGYLISTADGRPISVFGWFDVPATITWIPAQEDVAGDIHWYLALSIMSLAGLHALAALKHHFFDRDETLRRMLGRNRE